MSQIYEEEESLNINDEYTLLLDQICEAQLSKASNNNLEVIIAQTENLLKSVKNPTTLKLDARVFSEAVNASSDILEKSLRNFKLDTEAFLNLDHDTIERYFIRAKTFYYGIKFHKFISLEERVKPSITIRKAQSRSVKEEEEEKIDEPRGKPEREESNMQIAETIRNLVSQRHKIEYFRLVIDIESYSKTVENMFYLAFAVRMKMVNIKVISDVIYVVERNNSDEGEDSHMIVELDYDEYRELIIVLNLKKSLIA